MNIFVLASEGSPASAVAGPLEILSAAAYHQRHKHPDQNGAVWDVKVVAPKSNEIRCSHGMKLQPHQGITPFQQADIVIVGAIGIPPATMHFDPEVLEWLKLQAQGGAHMTSFCTGAFLLAATGLLTGRLATTHWAYAEHFSRCFPDVLLRAEKMLTCDGHFTCAGGATAYQDLSLHLIQKYLGREAAVHCSKWLLMPLDRELQNEFVQYQAKKWHPDKLILNIQQWIEQHYAEDISVVELAAQACLSERHFKRRFKAATGDSPLQYLQQVRIDAAKTALEQSTRSVESISAAVGYSDLAFFRLLFKRTAGVTPLQYRRKFGG